MIVLFWNMKGLGKPAKRRMTTDTMVRAKADIVCLSETKLKASSSSILNAFGPHRINKWYCKDVEGASGGILIGYDSSIFSLEEVWTGIFSLSLVLKGLRDNFLKSSPLCTGLTEELPDQHSGRISSSLSSDGIFRGLSGRLQYCKILS